jgi:hypothetical protein
MYDEEENAGFTHDELTSIEEKANQLLRHRASTALAEDQVYEVYVRTADGETYHTDLRTGLKQFLDPEKGYRISLDIDGVVITLRNSWDISLIKELDEHLGHKSIEVCATIRGLDE